METLLQFIPTNLEWMFCRVVDANVREIVVPIVNEKSFSKTTVVVAQLAERLLHST